MSKIRMNWDKESQGSGDYQVYPDGTYKVSITGFEQVTASTGTPQIRWKATILEPQEYVGKPITMHTALTEKSLWKLARLVKACGLDVKALGQCEINTPAFLHVLDQCCRRSTYWHLIVTPNPKGQPRNEVDDFKVDQDQEAPSIVEDDVPEFLKEEA